MLGLASLTIPITFI